MKKINSTPTPLQAYINSTPTPTPTKVCPAPTPYNSTPIWKNTTPTPTPTLPKKVPTPELTPTPSWSCPSLGSSNDNHDDFDADDYNGDDNAAPLL
ncbi:unnamed protein product [Rotaria magnacalcarata]|nr:unnamed protein product [Rotaria magnacalcarata]